MNAWAGTWCLRENEVHVGGGIKTGWVTVFYEILVIIQFVIVQSLSLVRLFKTPWAVVCRAPLSIRFPRQNYWSGLLFPSPGDLPDPGNEPGSPALQEDAFTLWTTREAIGWRWGWRWKFGYTEDHQTSQCLRIIRANFLTLGEESYNNAKEENLIPWEFQNK